MEDKRRPFRVGDVVKHFKYNSLTSEERLENKYLYKIVGTCIHSETKEKMMIYQALYYPYEIYTRPYDMFISLVDTTKYPNAMQLYRFEALDFDESRKVMDRCRNTKMNIDLLLDSGNRRYPFV